jgi:hypothetical protein
MDVAVGSYIRFKNKCGGYVQLRNFQNFFVSETRTFGGTTYVFAPFYISGNVSTRGGDSMQANFTTIPNALTSSLTAEAVLNGWLIEVKTVLLNFVSGSFTEGQVLTEQIWSCSSKSDDFEKISVGLSTPLDATRAQVPKRVLSEFLVGALPPTGSIFAR